MNIPDEIDKLAARLEKQASTCETKALDRLEEAANQVGKAWSGSWLGYHSRVYYKGLVPAPPGSRFSMEWGFLDTFGGQGTRGDWGEFPEEAVMEAIQEMADSPNLPKFEERSQKTHQIFEDAQSRLLSLLAPYAADEKTDKFLKGLLSKIENEKRLRTSDFIKYLQPSGTMFSRDVTALTAGLKTPPHFHVIARVLTIRHPYTLCANLAKHAKRVREHITILGKKREQANRLGTHVFIGHGRSKLWKELKDFVQDRLNLPWDEFNRVPVAGVANIARLSQMLDNTAIAFLIMTAEDEQADGTLHARLNVVHEAGLFQGRLGFERAILLVEEGCEEFSNAHGLGQLRFPKGNIAAIFEEIRRVLEREKLLEE